MVWGAEYTSRPHKARLESKRTTKQRSERLSRYTVGCGATVYYVMYCTRTVLYDSMQYLIKKLCNIQLYWCHRVMTA